MSRKRRAPHVAAVAAAALAVALSGCSSQDEPATEPSFAATIESTIEEARAEGAGPEQLAMLEEIAESGEVTLEAARIANQNAIRCMNDRGVHAIYEDMNTGTGAVTPGYGAQIDGELGEEVSEQIIDECDAQENFWVSGLYQTQPSSMEQQEAYLASIAPQLRQCLLDAGYEVADDATPDEIQMQIFQTEYETGEDLGCFSDTSEPTE